MVGQHQFSFLTQWQNPWRPLDCERCLAFDIEARQVVWSDGGQLQLQRLSVKHSLDMVQVDEAPNVASEGAVGRRAASDVGLGAVGQEESAPAAAAEVISTV